MFSLLTEGKELMCQVKIGKIKVKAWIDTGASVSLISRVAYDHLKTWKGLRKLDLIISQANGKEIAV